jgi:hypothetical protein
VGFNLGTITINGSTAGNVIYKSGSPDSITLSVAAAAGYTDIAWYVDGAPEAKSLSNTLIINASDYPVQLHSVTFRGYKNGVPFSQAIPFMVLD